MIFCRRKYDPASLANSSPTGSTGPNSLAWTWIRAALSKYTARYVVS